MANRVEDRLIPALYEEFLYERFVQLSTIDHQTGGPNVSALSWVHAKDEFTILFAVDHRSRIITNLEKQPLIVLNIIANETSYSISGSASIIGQSSSDVPIVLSIIKLTIREVRDVMFYGAKIISEPKFNKTYDEEAAKKLDQQVMTELKQH
ncbi:pyridoxamine 5'-phosphate oxidase family protein [Jeotgalibacillus marinus]|uniref:Pyridoxamine 5'-phosphate oxidase family protein n=1 Tax=Jeotgalibacillus marinus TaxID=86667 RepID=A0ABV3Q3C3_9BACL